MHAERKVLSSPTQRLSALFAGAMVCAALAFAVQQAFAQAPAPAATAAASSSASKPASAKSSGASASKTVKAPQPTKPLWTELTEAQRQALAPLSGKWDSVSEAQKRKWLAMSQNYPKLSAPEQAKLHSRMSEWVALSPQQRTQARLNFGNTKEIPPDDKKAKWEAYQALSPEEKRKLAAGASKPPATAAAIKPVSPDKLAKVPPRSTVTKPPRIAAGANQVDQNTLLPQPPVGATN